MQKSVNKREKDSAKTVGTLNVHYPGSKSHIVDECIDVGGAKVEKRQECLSKEEEGEREQVSLNQNRGLKLVSQYSKGERG